MLSKEASAILELIRSIPVLVEEKRTFLLLIDGLGLNDLRVQGGFTKKTYRTVFPSSTPPFFYSLYSLLEPAQHGYLEWYMRLKGFEEPVAVLPWKTLSGKALRLGKEIKRKDVFPFESLSEILAGKGRSMCFYTPYADSAFVKVTNRKAKVVKIDYFSEIFPLGEYDFSLIYWPSADTVLHRRSNQEALNVELDILSFYVKLLWKRIPRGSRLIVMSDHGLTMIKRRYLLPSIKGEYPVGGGRVAFYKNAEKVEVERVIKEKRIPAIVMSLKELFGYNTEINKRCYENFGRVALIAKDRISFKYPFEEAGSLRPAGFHGGRNMEEIYVNVWIGEK